MKTYYVYILTNKSNTTLYIGITNNLSKRIEAHKSNNKKSFTNKYNLHKLIYFEEFKDVKEAIRREKTLKNWHREWKYNLVKSVNPSLEELQIY